jgi:CheY-like chemotaxis protein
MSAVLLLVEDDELNRNALSRLLARRGYQVELAADGETALERVAAAVPDLVLMDLSLPGLDGLETTRRLRALPAGAALPVIALTGHTQEEDRALALAAGCSDFASKPVDLARLLEQIEALLPGRR